MCTSFCIPMSRKSAACIRNDVAGRFSPLSSRETSSRTDVPFNAKTNGYRWERGLGCERHGLQHSQRRFPFVYHPFFIFNFWITLVNFRLLFLLYFNSLTLDLFVFLLLLPLYHIMLVLFTFHIFQNFSLFYDIQIKAKNEFLSSPWNTA